MKQIKARRIAEPAPSLLCPRDLALAGLGVASIARRKGREALSQIKHSRGDIAERVQLELGAAGGRAVELARSARDAASEAAAPLVARAQALFGVSAKPARKPRKPAAKRQSARAAR
ncbi:MAG: hypothetical protein MEQ07_09755 [Aquimonas sp.]|nr:hypothetical protein [Aquimonas sp.]